MNADLSAILWALALLAMYGVLAGCAVLLVHAEERERDREEAARRRAAATRRVERHALDVEWPS